MIKNTCIAITAMGGALLLTDMAWRFDIGGFSNLVHSTPIHGLLLLAIAVRVTLK